MKHNQKIKIAIIDDEAPARMIIRSFLMEHEDIEILCECENGFDGAMAIKDLNPDLVFLDIQMPKLTGFEMLELIEPIPLVIFTTAYDSFALKAFEVNAVDYLLKPFSQKRFNQALQRALDLNKLGSRPQGDMNKLLEYTRSQEEVIQRIVVKTNNNIEILPVSRIEHIEAQDDYVFLHLDGGERFLKDLTMKYLEQHLDSGDFVRVHRSHIVRVERISRLESDADGSSTIRLKSGVDIPVSRSGLQRLKEMLRM
ncbi:MAG: LytTR family transcriptional regulator DNA-binding domain-containing protein [Bacteroidales bacterium]|nr:LytTR family transcriptional regulator DNA-binding domain-containing protein [Bacteroidales bacterium]